MWQYFDVMPALSLLFIRMSAKYCCFISSLYFRLHELPLSLLTSSVIDLKSSRLQIISSKSETSRFCYNREFPISPFPELEVLLNRMKSKSKNDYLFSWERSQKPTSHLRRAIETLGIDTKGHHGFHIIRKTRINELVRNPKLEPGLVAELSGHSIKVMQKYYLAEYGAVKTAELLRKAGYGK